MTAAAVVALAGGVGGAKLADGLAAHLGDRLSVVVNTGDDCERHGLLVMPDHDTVLYNLAGIEQVEWGWGIEGDTYATMAQLVEYGEEGWFSLGDRDLALHIARTARVRAGGRLTTVCLDLQAALGVRSRILPMADEPVRTEVRADDGWLEFQEYFVHRRQAPDVLEIRLAGVAASRATPEVSAALAVRRRDRHLPLEPAGLGWADPRGARDARGGRRGPGARRTGRRREPDRRRPRAQGPRGPDARLAGPRGDGARASPGSMPTWRTCSSSTRSTRRSPRRSRRSGSERSSPTRS